MISWPDRKLDWRRIALLLALMAGADLSVRAAALSIQLLPASPTERDSIVVMARGVRVDSCWLIDHVVCLAEGDSLTVNVFLLDTADETFCLPELVPYETHCRFGPLAAGHHAAHVNEFRESHREPGSQDARMEFDVAEVTASRVTTWGKIRAVFR